MKMTRIQIMREAVVKITRMLTGMGISVTQQGTDAYVKSDASGRPVQVNLPYIPDNATEELLNAIQGFLDHEVAHILFTDFNVVMKANREGLGFEHNVVEDAYIERKMAARFPGSAFNLANTRQFYIDKFVIPTFTAAQMGGDMKGQVSALMVSIIRGLGGQDVFLKLLAQPPFAAVAQPIIDLLKDLAPRMQAADSSAENLEIAREIAKRLRNPSAGKGESTGEGETESEGESKGKSKKSKSAKGEKGEKDKESAGKEEAKSGGKAAASGTKKDKSKEKSEDEKEEGEGEKPEKEEGKEKGKSKNDEGEGEGESEPDEKLEDEGEEGEGKPGDEGEGEGAGEEGEPDEEEGEGEPGEDDDGEHGEGEGEAGDEPGGDDDDAEAAHRDDLTDEETTGAASGTIDPSSSLATLKEINFDKANDFDKTVSAKISEVNVDLSRNADYLVFTKDQDRIEPVRVGGGYRDKMLTDMDDRVGHMVGPMQKDLERAIAARSRAVWNPGQRRGRLNPASLSRLAVQDARVFRTREEHTSKDVAVGLLMDNSGSMAGEKVQVACDAGYALAQTLDRCNIKCEALGFTTGSYAGDPAKVAEAESKMGRRYSRRETLYMPIFKAFGERFTPEVRKRFAWVPNSGILRNNIDGESVEMAALRLLQRPEKGKVLIVLSDGYPSASGQVGDLYDHLKRTVEAAERSGVKVVGIGIQSSAVRQFYKRNVVMNKVEELPKLVMKELRTLLFDAQGLK
jgi:cobalamin biosynthesis protein CobT